MKKIIPFILLIVFSLAITSGNIGVSIAEAKNHTLNDAKEQLDSYLNKYYPSIKLGSRQ